MSYNSRIHYNKERVLSVLRTKYRSQYMRGKWKKVEKGMLYNSKLQSYIISIEMLRTKTYICVRANKK